MVNQLKITSSQSIMFILQHPEILAFGLTLLAIGATLFGLHDANHLMAGPISGGSSGSS